MNFQQADVIVAGTEAGYVNDPSDPGGETKYGISKRAHPNVDIANLTIEAAREIRKTEYWDAIGCDSLPVSFALMVYDSAINNGVGRAKQFLALARKKPEGAAQEIEFDAQRFYFMGKISTWTRFGLGWSRRICSLPYQAHEGMTSMADSSQYTLSLPEAARVPMPPPSQIPMPTPIPVQPSPMSEADILNEAELNRHKEHP